jgi:hypothetical protein
MVLRHGRGMAYFLRIVEESLKATDYQWHTVRVTLPFEVRVTSFNMNARFLYVSATIQYLRIIILGSVETLGKCRLSHIAFSSAKLSATFQV